MIISNSIETDDFPLVEEVRFQMYLNGLYNTDFLCTPDSVNELVAGNLYINSNIQAIDDIEKIQIKEYKIEVNVSVNQIQTNRMSSGKKFLIPEIAKLKVLAETMFERALLYRQSGGIHCSALSDGNNIVAFMEDIGRHNAFDKVVGKALFDGKKLGDLIYFTSGRVNYEVMNKAIACGIPLIVSRSIMSTAAFEQAEGSGPSVIGRILNPMPVIYEGRKTDVGSRK